MKIMPLPLVILTRKTRAVYDANAGDRKETQSAVMAGDANA